MKEFDKLLKEMDLSYFGTGTHKITIEKVMELRKTDEVFVLDVRSIEENTYVTFPFSYNIPLHQLPDRLSELPKDKTIAVFCSSATRAAIVYPYLLMLGYDTKILLDTVGALSGSFKPGYILKNCD